MPLYDFRCGNGHVYERMVKLADFGQIQLCTCGAPSARMIGAPLFSVDNVGYACPITDRWIGSKREHEENLRRHNCRVSEAGEFRQARESADRADAETERKMDQTVEKFWDRLEGTERETLTNGLEAGMDLAVERRTGVNE